MERMAVTGGAGFIGSNLAEYLLARGHAVSIIDNFTSGREENLNGWAKQASVEILRADINETERLKGSFDGVRYVFHLAAIPSVPGSISNPVATNAANIDGTLSVLLAARDAGVKRVVIASSCAVYGDDPGLPKSEDMPGRPLSPYALSKQVCEAYARLFYQLYGLETVCLRFFNVFGPRQDPKSEYAAVIPRFLTRILAGNQPIIYGDGEQTRDFIYVQDVVEANWIAASHPAAAGEVFNVAQGKQTSLNMLVRMLSRIMEREIRPIYEPARTGEIRHSVADVRKARERLQYSPAFSIEEGVKRSLDWCRNHNEATHGPA